MRKKSSQDDGQYGDHRSVSRNETIDDTVPWSQGAAGAMGPLPAPNVAQEHENRTRKQAD